MQNLVYAIKMIVGYSVGLAFLSLTIACKETDGFKAATFPVAGQNKLLDAGKAEFTDTARLDIENRLKELENIEEDVALKDEKISQMQIEMDDLKNQIENNNSLFSDSTDLSPDQLLNIKSQNEVLSLRLEEIVKSYNDYISDREKQDQILMDKYTAVVNELSKYETTADSKAFKDAMADKLTIYESDREKLAEMILEKEHKVEELKQRLSGIQDDQDPDSLEKQNQINEELSETQQSLVALNKRMDSLETLITDNQCVLDLSSCISDIDEPKVGNEAKAFELSQKIKILTDEKTSLEEIVKKLDVELLKINNEMAINKSTDGFYADKIYRDRMNQVKSFRLQDKKDALDRIAVLSHNITQLQKQIVGL